MKIICVNENDGGQRVDKFLTKFLPAMPKSLLYKQLRKKRVKRDQKALGPQDILTAGDVLYLYINDEFFEEKPRPMTDAKELTIVYEDENILIADKPAGQAAHGDGDSLLNQIQSYLFEKGEYDPKKEHSFAPSLSHRIDKNTRGLVLAAKNAKILKALNEKIKNGEVTKEYLCVATGHFKKPIGRLEHFLTVSDKDNRVTVCHAEQKGAKKAVLEYEVLRETNDASFVRVTLLTGRKHQIRVQFSAVGHPLVGDTKYGAPRDDRSRYQALCAYRLTFSFKTDSGILEYLQGKTVALNEDSLFPWLLSDKGL